MIIPDIGINKLVEDGFLPPGLTIGPSSVDLTFSDSFSWPDQDKDKIILGESVPQKQVQRMNLFWNQIILYSPVPQNPSVFPTTWRLMWRDVKVSDAWDCRYKMRVLLMQDFTDK